MGEGYEEVLRWPPPPNGGADLDWKSKLRGIGGASHVDRVRAQLALFAAVPEAVLEAIGAQRRSINAAKHQGEYFATEQNYRLLVQAIAEFWNAFSSQEEFTP